MYGASQRFNAQARRSAELFMVNGFSLLNPPSRQPRNQAAVQNSIVGTSPFQHPVRLSAAHTGESKAYQTKRETPADPGYEEDKRR
jgi:hypothetical protein